MIPVGNVVMKECENRMIRELDDGGGKEVTWKLGYWG